VYIHTIAYSCNIVRLHEMKAAHLCVDLGVLLEPLLRELVASPLLEVVAPLLDAALPPSHSRTRQKLNVTVRV
jgi:hypothetical protein